MVNDDIPGGEKALPRLPNRAAAPRDLRTADELRANGYEQLGAARAEYVTDDGTPTPLYSTSEARRLKYELWPRGGRALKGGRPEAVDGSPAPFGAAAGAQNPGGSSRRAPGAPRRLRYAPPGDGVVAPHGDPRAWLQELFAAGFVVIDTETTGLGARAEIVEVAAVDEGGEVLLESKAWPRSGRVPASATRVHGLTIDDLRGAPSWPELLLELERTLEGRRVLAWNAPFDERMIQQSSRRWSLVPQLPRFECAMRGYSLARGIGRGAIRLERAALVERVLTAPQSHRSLGDAQLVLAVLKSLAESRAATA